MVGAHLHLQMTVGRLRDAGWLRRQTRHRARWCLPHTEIFVNRRFVCFIRLLQQHAISIDGLLECAVLIHRRGQLVISVIILVQRLLVLSDGGAAVGIFVKLSQRLINGRLCLWLREGHDSIPQHAAAAGHVIALHLRHHSDVLGDGRVHGAGTGRGVHSRHQRPAAPLLRHLRVLPGQRRLPLRPQVQVRLQWTAHLLIGRTRLALSLLGVLQRREGGW